MKAGKFLVVLLVICAVTLMAGTVFGAVRKVGHISKLNMTSEEFKKINDSYEARGKIQIFTIGEHYTLEHFFYDSLISMQMALNAGEIDEMALPEDVAEYVMNVNGGYTISSIIRTMPSSLSFGFRKDDDPAMLNSFNEAILSMKADGTLAVLSSKYVAEAGIEEPDPVEFETYENIGTKVKIAVTGDIPPMDFVTADGKPAGFNTAVIAEIGRRLKINIELVTIDSGARAASLASHRVDAVFWLQFQKGADKQADVPEGIALSEPYYSWNEVISLKKK